MFTKNNRLLLAVSGGVDSVVLSHLCKQAGFNFGIAHCNFQLRGEDSDKDETFVKSLAGELSVPFYVERFDTKKFAIENKYATQEAARILRYEWFEKIRTSHQYDYVLTAHHADDNIETVVMNFFRGTGLKGLTGIKEKTGKLIRPLLYAKRMELEEYLKTNNWDFVQDESNLTDDYTRNYFRNTILPLIKKTYPEVQDNILKNIERFKDVEIIYKKEIERFSKKIFIKKGGAVNIPILLLQKTTGAKTILLELLKPYNFTPAQVPEILRLMDSDSGRYILSPTHRMLKDRKHLMISPIDNTEKLSVIIEKQGNYHFQNGMLKMERHETIADISYSNDIVCIDATKIHFPLILRPWRTGDYFYPLGMTKKKKLSRFFIDNKLSLFDKEKIWVVEMDKKIVWIVGFRIDNRFKITPTTKSIIQIELKQNK